MKINYIICHVCNKRVIATGRYQLYCSHKCMLKNLYLKRNLQHTLNPTNCKDCRQILYSKKSIRCHRCQNRLINPQNPRNAYIRYYREQGLSYNKLNKMFNLSNWRINAICKQKGFIYVGEFGLKFNKNTAYI